MTDKLHDAIDTIEKTVRDAVAAKSPVYVREKSLGFYMAWLGIMFNELPENRKKDVIARFSEFNDTLIKQILVGKLKE